MFGRSLSSSARAQMYDQSWFEEAAFPDDDGRFEDVLSAKGLLTIRGIT